MTRNDELNRLRQEARELRQRTATVERAHGAQQNRADALEKKVATQAKTIRELDDRIHELEEENAALKSRLGLEIEKAKKYAGMIFKASIRKLRHAAGSGRGGKRGHKGNGRKIPERIDRAVDVFLTHCNACGTALNRTSSVDARVVEDVPQTTTLVTRYRIERQWCASCHREVRGIPAGVIPGCRFGVGVLALVLTLKYRLRTPLRRIEELLQAQYRLSITSQGIQELLHTVQTKFTKQYNDILEEIRRAPVKHADETGWRIDGKNGWCWLFATPTAALYTIEETRGKGVPERIFGHDPTGVLVRDDYGGYEKLPLAQQSCWTHLLRVSREAKERDGASEAMRALHGELKALFGELKAITLEPFRPQIRARSHETYLTKIDAIVERAYVATDAIAVQTRIRNQRGNLLTALLHEHVPLTNNHAERMVRPMVVTRKISGGSRSARGAETHAVNMSVMQTLALQGKNIFAEIASMLQAGNSRYARGDS